MEEKYLMILYNIINFRNVIKTGGRLQPIPKLKKFDVSRIIIK